MNINDLYDPKLTPATLALHLDPGWVPAPFLMHTSAIIANRVSRGGARIMVSVPPRHGKSRMLSIGSTTWVLERFHNFFVGLTTYGASLSLDFSTAVRDQVLLNPDKLDVRIKSGSNRADRWLTTTGGGVIAVGLGGPITGRGVNILFIDDYIKEIKEALSADYLKYIWEWFITTAMTRLEPNASTIIVATRWVENDLIGEIIKNQGLKSEGGDWEYIRIPAIAEHDDPLGRQLGEALFPQRYDVPALLQIKRLLGTRWFDAIYQQNPHGASSKVARKEWINVIPASQVPNPTTLSWARVWDLAGSYRAGDYTAGLLIGADKLSNSIYITDVVRGQFSADEVEKTVKRTAESDGSGVPIYIEQEPGSSGILLIHNFKGKLSGYSVNGILSTKSKLARAQPMLAAAEDGGVFLVGGPWTNDLLEEFDGFGSGAAYDDQVDCMANGWNQLIGFNSLGATWGRGKGRGHKSQKDDAQTNRPGAIQVAQPVVNSIIHGATWGRRRSGLLVPRDSTTE